MKRVYGIIDLYGAPDLGELTKRRNFGSVTFLGRYGLIDFAMSNFSNSGIDNIGIVIDKYPASIRSHLKNGESFTLNTKTGSLSVLYDDIYQDNERATTDIATIQRVYPAALEEKHIEYVIVAPSHYLMSIDYSRIIASHIKSKAEVTVVYQHRTDLNEEFLKQDVLTIKDGFVKSVKMNSGKNPEGDISLSTFIINKNFFNEILKNQPIVNPKFGIKDMLKQYLNKKELKIFAYEFPKTVYPVLSLKDYIDQSFAMLSFTNRKVLFHDDWPIYTTTHNTPPALYGESAKVSNSFIANGAIIRGTVENSIISRDVVIKENAVVKNSILFTNTEVGKGVKLNHVLTDKSVSFSRKKSFSGNEKDFIIFKQGEKF